VAIKIIRQGIIYLGHENHLLWGVEEGFSGGEESVHQQCFRSSYNGKPQSRAADRIQLSQRTLLSPSGLRIECIPSVDWPCLVPHLMKVSFLLVPSSSK